MSGLHRTSFDLHYAGFFDVTPYSDGGVLKGPTSRAADRTCSGDSDAAAAARAAAALACARGGELTSNTQPWEYPVIAGCPCAVQYVVRWAASSTSTHSKSSKSSNSYSNSCSSGSDDGGIILSEDRVGAVLGSSRDVVGGKHVGGTDDPADFTIGRGEVIVGVELAVTTLQHPGDKATFVLRADYAFGHRGDGFKVPPHAQPLEVELELVFVRAPLPLLPKGPALAQQQKLRKARERAEADASTLPLSERLAAAALQREVGNACVLRCDWEAAKQAYDRGFMALVVTTDEWEGLGVENSDGGGLPARPPLPPSDKALVAAEKARLHCNR
jgi:hypothetical protein